MTWIKVFTQEDLRAFFSSFQILIFKEVLFTSPKNKMDLNRDLVKFLKVNSAEENLFSESDPWIIGLCRKRNLFLLLFSLLSYFLIIFLSCFLVFNLPYLPHDYNLFDWTKFLVWLFHLLRLLHLLLRWLGYIFSKFDSKLFPNNTSKLTPSPQKSPHDWLKKTAEFYIHFFK